MLVPSCLLFVSRGKREEERGRSGMRRACGAAMMMHKIKNGQQEDDVLWSQSHLSTSKMQSLRTIFKIPLQVHSGVPATEPPKKTARRTEEDQPADPQGLTVVVSVPYWYQYCTLGLWYIIGELATHPGGTHLSINGEHGATNKQEMM